MNSTALQTERPNYGLDAPGLVKLFIGGGIALIAVSMAPRFIAVSADLGETLSGFGWPGFSFAVSGLLMIWSSYYGKFRARDKLVSKLNLKGSETVLDLGCGRGLILLGVAKKLSTGKALGIDLWSQTDLSSNSKEAVLGNAKIEGLADRVQILDGDMRKLPLADQSVDAVTASMSIHNIPTRDGRRKAIQETARVLRPGGRVALLDFKCTGEYEAALRDCGLKNVSRSVISFWNFPPSRTVFGEKVR